MLSAFVNAFRTPDLRRKLLFVLLVIVVFRAGSQIPAPGVNVANVEECVKQATEGDNASLYSLVNLFSGGALLQLTVFALGIMPYITASIILQLLVVVIPRREALKKEGQAGQTKITQYTRYLTLGLAVLQATGIVALARTGNLLQNCQINGERAELLHNNDSTRTFLVLVVTMVAGTAVIMWLGELITERGVGNGMSLLIFTSIAATFPTAMWSIQMQNGWVSFILVLIVGLLAVTPLGTIVMEQIEEIRVAQTEQHHRLVHGRVRLARGVDGEPGTAAFFARRRFVWVSGIRATFAWIPPPAGTARATPSWSPVTSPTSSDAAGS